MWKTWQLLWNRWLVALLKHPKAILFKHRHQFLNLNFSGKFDWNPTKFWTACTTEEIFEKECHFWNWVAFLLTSNTAWLKCYWLPLYIHRTWRSRQYTLNIWTTIVHIMQIWGRTSRTTSLVGLFNFVRLDKKPDSFLSTTGNLKGTRPSAEATLQKYLKGGWGSMWCNTFCSMCWFS